MSTSSYNLAYSQSSNDETATPRSSPPPTGSPSSVPQTSRAIKKTTRRSSLSPDPNLVCDICKQVYSRKDNLRAHRRVHTGERPYHCTECGLRFRWLGGLRSHKCSRQKGNRTVKERAVSAPPTSNLSYEHNRGQEGEETSQPRDNVSDYSELVRRKADNEDDGTPVPSMEEFRKGLVDSSISHISNHDLVGNNSTFSVEEGNGYIFSYCIAPHLNGDEWDEVPPSVGVIPSPISELPPPEQSPEQGGNVVVYSDIDVDAGNSSGRIDPFCPLFDI